MVDIVIKRTANDQDLRRQLSEELTTISNLAVAAAYGGIRLDTLVDLPDIGAGFITMEADAGALATPREVVQDVAGNGLRFSLLSVLSVSINISLLHNELSQSRTVQVRLFNVDKGSGTTSATIGIARNQPATNISISLLLEIPTANLGDLFVVQVGNATPNDLASVIEQSFGFTAFAVSEFRG